MCFPKAPAAPPPPAPPVTNFGTQVVQAADQARIDALKLKQNNQTLFGGASGQQTPSGPAGGSQLKSLLGN